MDDPVYWPFDSQTLAERGEGWEGWIHIDELINHNQHLFVNALASVHEYGSKLSGQLVRVKRLKGGVSCKVFSHSLRPRDCRRVESTDPRFKLPLIPVIEFKYFEQFLPVSTDGAA